jgi:hypothetical protein
MTWEKCRNYGFIEIQINGSLKLHYDRSGFILLSNPNLYMTVTSACWQGNSVIVRGYNQYREPLCYIARSQYESEKIA